MNLVILSGMGCFDVIFSLQVMDDIWPYQVPPRRIMYALQDPLKEEVEILQKQQITVSLHVDEISEWCNSFVLVPKANGKVQLYLD